jgi:hypothetical protein
MKPIRHPIDNQNGSAMVIALIIMALLTIIGHLATRSTRLELQTATNDLRHKQAFYTADGISEMAAELLEQNLACSTGFTILQKGGLIEVLNADFWKNNLVAGQVPSDDDRDVRIPLLPPDGTDDTQPHTNIVYGGTTAFGTGSALQIAAGYEGKGKSIAGGGAFMVFEQSVQHRGNFNAEACVQTQWRHIIGDEGECEPLP